MPAPSALWFGNALPMFYSRCRNRTKLLHEPVEIGFEPVLHDFPSRSSHTRSPD